MKKPGSVLAVLLCTGTAFAQGRGGGGTWTTANFDAQRTSWVRSDARISPDSVKTNFRFLWKFQVQNESRQLNSLTQPVMLGGLHSYTGLVTMLVMGASSGTAYAVEADLGRLEWKHAFGATPPAPASLACPGGVTSGLTRQVSLAAAPPAGRGGAPGGRGGRAGGAVGQPDQGAPNIGQAGGGRGGSGGRGGRGPAPAVAPEDGAAPPVGRGRGGGVNLGATDAFYSVAGDGTVHALNVQDGSDLAPPVKFLPPNANASGLMLFDRVLYAATTNNCGGAANGLWAIDLASPDQAVTTWKTNGGGIAGTVGAAAGTDGTLYLATTDGDVVALAPKTLAMKGSFTPGKTPFTASPVVFPDNGKDWIVAANQDGRLYLLDSTALHTAAYVTPKISNSASDFTAGALATWQDAEGTRWVLAPVEGAIAAFRVVTQNGKPTLQSAWTSRELISPAPPMIVNGVVFALATGEFHSGDPTLTAAQRAQRSTPAILYALDAATGKELWNSGKTITSFVHSGGLSSGNSQVYVSTYDNTLYTFGIPLEH